MVPGLIFIACINCSGFAYAQNNSMWIYSGKSVGDTLWKKRVWREITLRDKCNDFFVSDSGMPCYYSLVRLLVNGVLEGGYYAYREINDSVRSALTKDEMLWKINGYTLEEKKSFNSAIYPAEVTKICIEEIWVYNSSEGKMIVHLTGIAPAKDSINAKGVKATLPIFWFNYPEIQKFLARHGVDCPSGLKHYTWNEFFETRQFCSRITKVDGEKKWPGKKKE